MKYKLVMEYTETEFLEAVAYWLEKGWKPQGGVSFKPSGQDTATMFVQAMVLEKK